MTSPTVKGTFPSITGSSTCPSLLQSCFRVPGREKFSFFHVCFSILFLLRGKSYRWCFRTCTLRYCSAPFIYAIITSLQPSAVPQLNVSIDEYCIQNTTEVHSAAGLCVSWPQEWHSQTVGLDSGALGANHAAQGPAHISQAGRWQQYMPAFLGFFSIGF